MECLTLFILYAWKIILNCLSRTRVAKYFRSVKIGPVLKDCPLIASMTLPTRLYSLTFALYNPKILDAALWFSWKTKWKTWSFTSPSVLPQRQAGAPCLEDIWVCWCTPCSALCSVYSPMASCSARCSGPLHADIISKCGISLFYFSHICLCVVP